MPRPRLRRGCGCGRERKYRRFTFTAYSFFIFYLKAKQTGFGITIRMTIASFLFCTARIYVSMRGRGWPLKCVVFDDDFYGHQGHIQPYIETQILAV